MAADGGEGIRLLGLHILGPGYGESIIVELPGGEVGVIDAFKGRHTPPPALAFLRSQYPALTSLKFVALTHPHADHCMGISDLFENYRVEEFWYFHSFLQHARLGFFQVLREHGTRDAVEKALDFPVGSVHLESLRVNDAVQKLKKSIKPRQLIAARRVDLGGQVTARFLTPNDASVWRYNAALEKAVTSLIIDGPTLNPDWDPSGLPHNLASGAILFEYGQTRILLMADAENELWSGLINDEGDHPLPKVHFIKGAHHGSANGYNAKVYHCAADKKTILVITPFNRHEHPLPTTQGVGSLIPHVKEVYCTNGVEACQSSGLAWRYAPTGSSPALPPGWAIDCRANPALLSLLAGQQSTHPYSSANLPVPWRWLRDCQSQPELLQLLCPELRNRKVVGPRPHLNDEFRVSIRYDDSGNVLDQFVGWGVGHLPGS